MMPKNTAKIIRFLLRGEEKTGYNINQVATSLSISAGSAFKILKDLEKNGLASLKKLGNASFYSINLENPEAMKICELLLLEEKRHLAGYAKIYAEALQEFDKAEMIVLFGSVLKKKEFNDVDALFVTGNAKEAGSFCLNISKIRAKPVVPLILKKEDIIRELKAGKEVMQTIIKEGIVLKGENVFVEIIKNAKA